jgi:hypothetical protein
MHLGVIPRFRVLRTSETEKGQIYIPLINWLLLFAVILLVVLFESSSALAAAYGIAVTGVMVITSCLLFIVAWKFWRWSPALAALVIAPFLAIELVFLSANVLKIPQGGWFPLLVGTGVFILMRTWRKGTRSLTDSAGPVDFRPGSRQSRARGQWHLGDRLARGPDPVPQQSRILPIEGCPPLQVLERVARTGALVPLADPCLEVGTQAESFRAIRRPHRQSGNDVHRPAPIAESSTPRRYSSRDIQAASATAAMQKSAQTAASAMRIVASMPRLMLTLRKSRIAISITRK